MGARADADVGCVGFLYWVASDGELQQAGKVYYCRTANVQPGQAPCAASKNQPNGTAIKNCPKPEISNICSRAEKQRELSGRKKKRTEN